MQDRQPGDWVDGARLSRRTFLGQAAAASAMAFAGRHVMGSESTFTPPPAQADSCIFIWLGGGACHIDTWDPKIKGDAKARQAGSYYDAIPTVVPGMEVCQHLQRTARLADRTILCRSVFHDVIDEHAAAVNRVHVGRPPSGTTIYPAIGSVVAHELGARGDGVPAYVVMGYPSASRGPGFLGAKHGYIYLTDTELGPAGLKRPDDVNEPRQQRREQLLGLLRERYLERTGKQGRIEDYAEASVQALELAGPRFMSVFDLKSESPSLRESYGGEFGQRCLLARRLTQEGVRFVEVSFNLNFINGTGWDTHNDGQLNQHILIDQLDQALAALITDLERHQRLDQTLIVVATEFGRPPEFDAGGGRGHYSKAFSMVLAGGGLKTGQVIGVTDELGKNILARPISIADFHATIYAALGIEHAKELYDAERPVPITDRGHPLQEVFRV